MKIVRKLEVETQVKYFEASMNDNLSHTQKTNGISSFSFNRQQNKDMQENQMEKQRQNNDN